MSPSVVRIQTCQDNNLDAATTSAAVYLRYCDPTLTLDEISHFLAKAMKTKVKFEVVWDHGICFLQCKWSLFPIKVKAPMWLKQECSWLKSCKGEWFTLCWVMLASFPTYTLLELTAAGEQKKPTINLITDLDITDNIWDVRQNKDILIFSHCAGKIPLFHPVNTIFM